jgi:hypothetical protein
VLTSRAIASSCAQAKLYGVCIHVRPDPATGLFGRAVNAVSSLFRGPDPAPAPGPVHVPPARTTTAPSASTAAGAGAGTGAGTGTGAGAGAGAGAGRTLKKGESQRKSGGGGGGGGRGRGGRDRSASTTAGNPYAVTRRKLTDDEKAARLEVEEEVKALEVMAAHMTALSAGKQPMRLLQQLFRDWLLAKTARRIRNPDGHHCMSLAGASASGRDPESKTDSDAPLESKSGDDDRLRVSVPHATKLRVSLDKDSRIPPGYRLFARVAGAPATADKVVLRSLGARSVVHESRHPYENSLDEYHTVHIPGATSMLVRFDALTKTEAGCVVAVCGVCGCVRSRVSCALCVTAVGCPSVSCTACVRRPLWFWVVVRLGVCAPHLRCCATSGSFRLVIAVLSRRVADATTCASSWTTRTVRCTVSIATRAA